MASKGAKGTIYCFKMIETINSQFQEIDFVARIDRFN